VPFPYERAERPVFEDMLKEEERGAKSDYEVPPIKEVAAQDLVTKAFKRIARTERARGGVRTRESSREAVGY